MVKQRVYLCSGPGQPFSIISHAGVTSYGSQFCMTCALRYARAAPALAMSYISVVLTITYGYFIFHEVRLWSLFASTTCCSNVSR